MRFRFFKIRYLDGTWQTYKKLPYGLEDYHSVYVSISSFRNPEVVDVKYETVEERIKASGFLFSEMWIETDGEDFKDGLAGAYREIKEIHSFLRKDNSLSFMRAMFSGGGYYLIYKIKAPFIMSEIERFKYFKTFKIILLKRLLRRGFRPCHHYNANGKLDSPIINMWGVRRLENTFNWKRDAICSRINLLKYTVPRHRDLKKRDLADDGKFPPDATTGKHNPDERVGALPYAEKMISNVINKKRAFPVFEYFEEEFYLPDIALIQQANDLSNIYVYKKGKKYTCYSLDAMPKSKMVKSIKMGKSRVLPQWMKYNNVYFSTSDTLAQDSIIKSKHVCTLLRSSSKYVQIMKPRRRARIKMVTPR